MGLDLTDRQKLFESELPKWENIIASLANNLIYTRAIDRGLVEAQDIQNKLRLKLWDAIRKYDPKATGARGEQVALNTWITRLLRQECILIMQAHYHKVQRGRRRILFSFTDKEEQAEIRYDLNHRVLPECIRQGFIDVYLPLIDTATVKIRKKDAVWLIVDSGEIYTTKQLKATLNIYQEGKVLLPIPLVSSLEDTDREGFIDLPDLNATAALENVLAEPWFRKNVRLIFHVLQNREPKGLNEKKVFAMILSGRYGSDRDISKLLDVNFAKIGDVRFKAKIVFAIVEGIPISTFSRAQNAVTLAIRIRNMLKPIVGELPAMIL